MVWPPIYSVSLTFAGCPLQLYLLRMFCSSAHRKISFRTWFFQMFFNKSLIKCEKFVSCLMQYSKKYWKWPETYVLILHSYWNPQFQNFAIPLIWLSSHSIRGHSKSTLTQNSWVLIPPVPTCLPLFVFEHPSPSPSTRYVSFG